MVLPILLKYRLTRHSKTTVPVLPPPTWWLSAPTTLLITVLPRKIKMAMFCAILSARLTRARVAVVATVIVLTCKVNIKNVVGQSTMMSGLIGLIALFGIAWLADEQARVADRVEGVCGRRRSVGDAVDREERLSVA